MNPSTQTFQLPESVTGAREQANKLAGTAADYKAGENSVIDVLRQKVTQAYADNKDILGKLDETIAGYLPAPSVGREKFQDIWNPFQRESLVSQYIANQATPMLTYAGILGNRMGRIEDTIGAGVRGFQAQSAREQSRAELAQQNYQNLFNEFTTMEQLNRPTTQEVTANGRKYLVTYDSRGNIIKKQDLGSSTSGSGSNAFGDLSTAMETLVKLGIIPAGTTGGKKQTLDDFVEEDTPTPQQTSIAPPQNIFNTIDPVTGMSLPDPNKQNDFFSKYGNINMGGIIQPSGVVGASGARY